MKKYLKRGAFWLCLYAILICLTSWGSSQLSNSFYNNQLGADVDGNYGGNYTYTALTAATTGTVLVSGTPGKKIVVEKVVVSTDDEVNLSFYQGVNTAATQWFPTLRIGYRGGLVADPYVALPAGTSFWVVCPSTANYEVWTRYRKIY